MIIKLKNRVGWGREIHIVTDIAEYAGSGRALLIKPIQIVYRKPSRQEFYIDGFGNISVGVYRKPSRQEFYKNGWPKKVNIDGFGNISVGDFIEYEFDDDILPVDQRLITNGFRLLVTNVKYMRDPPDMFFAKGILVYSDGIKQHIG